MDMQFDWRDVLKRAREIVEGRGDKTPCVMGRFCPRCCAAIAKSELDREHDIPMPPSFSDFTYESDRPMVEARTRIAAHEIDTTKILTREEALAIIDAALED